jgi:hypothetical protein
MRAVYRILDGKPPTVASARGRPFDTFDFSKDELDSFNVDSVELRFSGLKEEHAKQVWVTKKQFSLPVNSEDEFHLADLHVLRLYTEIYTAMKDTLKRWG